MPARKGLLAPQNTFLDTIATRFDGTHSNFVLGNAQVAPLYPIVYCSDGFCDLTGYPRAHIMQKGCACKFLYGEDTGEEETKQIEEALQGKAELKIEVQFYRRDGSAFWCLLDIVPIKNEKREVVLFLASHKDITSTKLAELGERDGSDSDGECNQHLTIPVPNYGLLRPSSAAGCGEGGSSPSSANYGRRRSRAVLYQLSGHYNKPETKMKTKLGKINSNILHSPTPLPEYKTSSVQKSRLILLHYGVYKTCWDWVVLLCTVYVAIVVPYNASFTLDEYNQRPSVPADVLVESFFILDIVINFRTTFVNKKGEVVSDPSKIALNYLRSWFVVDLLAALPFDLLYASNVYSKDTMIHLLKLTRLLRLARLLQKMERYSEYSAMILTLMMLCFTLVAHWLACVWYVIAQEEKLASEQAGDWEIGWIHTLAARLQVSVENLTISNYYATSLYFTCSSLTSVGFGNVAADTDAEKIFSICTMLIGALMHAVVFGNVTAIIQRMYSRRNIHQSKLRDLKEFLNIYRVPKELKQRMHDYHQTMWSLNHGIDIHETLREFPEELRGDVSMHIHREVLSLPIFETASQGCLKVLSLHIRANFCAPGEYLVHKGDALQYIYYLCNGSMEVVQNDMVVAILGKGDLVGCDIQQKDVTGTGGVISSHGDPVIKSSCDVKALTYCDLKCIHLVGLLETLKMYPEFSEEFSKDIVHDLTHNLREGYESELFMNAMDGHARALSSQTLPSISENDEEDFGIHSAPPSPSRDPSSSAVVNNNSSAVKNSNLHHHHHGGGLASASSASRFARHKLQSAPPPIREEEEEDLETNTSSPVQDTQDGEGEEEASSEPHSRSRASSIRKYDHCHGCPGPEHCKGAVRLRQQRSPPPASPKQSTSCRGGGLWMKDVPVKSGEGDDQNSPENDRCDFMRGREHRIQLLYEKIIRFNREIHDLMMACSPDNRLQEQESLNEHLGSPAPNKISGDDQTALRAVGNKSNTSGSRRPSPSSPYYCDCGCRCCSSSFHDQHRDVEASGPIDDSESHAFGSRNDGVSYAGGSRHKHRSKATTKEAVKTWNLKETGQSFQKRNPDPPDGSQHIADVQAEKSSRNRLRQERAAPLAQQEGVDCEDGLVPYVVCDDSSRPKEAVSSVTVACRNNYSDDSSEEADLAQSPGNDSLTDLPPALMGEVATSDPESSDISEVMLISFPDSFIHDDSEPSGLLKTSRAGRCRPKTSIRGDSSSGLTNRPIPKPLQVPSSHDGRSSSLSADSSPYVVNQPLHNSRRLRQRNSCPAHVPSGTHPQEPLPMTSTAVDITESLYGS